MLLEGWSESTFKPIYFMLSILISSKNSMDLTVILIHCSSTFPSKTEAFTILNSYPAFPSHFIFCLHHNSNMMYK